MSGGPELDPQAQAQQAEQNIGADTASYGLNSNLTPDTAADSDDQRAAQEIVEQHRRAGGTSEGEASENAAPVSPD